MNIKDKMMDLVVTGSTAQSFGKSMKQIKTKLDGTKGITQKQTVQRTLK